MSEHQVPRALREEVFRLARGRCEYCQSQIEFSPAPFAVEHVQPASRGGTTELSNLALACSGYNGHKGIRTEADDPVTGGRAPLFHPRRERWDDHFAWSADFTLLSGRTPVGRATVLALRLNRPRLQRLRWALRLAGAHPPEPQPPAA